MPYRTASSVWLPSCSHGFARCRSEALYPGLWDGLEGCWDFSLGVTGARVMDWSGRGRHGTWQGSGNRWSVGRHGWSGEFLGTNDYVLLTHTPLWPAPVTIAFWALPSSAEPGVPFAQTLAAWPCPLLEIGWTWQRYYIFRRDDAGNTVHLEEPPDSHRLGDATLLAAVSRSASCHEMWIDGVLRLCSSVNLGPMTTDWTTIGAEYRFGSLRNFFCGQILWVAAWSRALAPAEIGLLYADPHALARPRRSLGRSLGRPAYFPAGQVDVAGQAAGQIDLPGLQAGHVDLGGACAAQVAA